MSSLASGPWPARNPLQNVNDLKAQIAANEKGARELKRMVEMFSLRTVEAYMGHVQDNADESVRRVIDRLADGEATSVSDQGAVIKVRISVDKARREATVDFTGTSPQQPTNFNAPEPVTRAAVLYVFRVMVDDDIPINAGCLRPIRVVLPEGSMLSPRYPAAVVAGNVEVSQAVTDTLFAALGALGSAQGTMNNLTFGDDTYQYYETICSGAPAGPGFDGAAAVHTHMTNSRLTDPEVLESRFPVVLEDFHIRRGSGGKGQWRAGDGTLRRIRFLRPMAAAILSGHRAVANPGAMGGEAGELGAKLSPPQRRAGRNPARLRRDLCRSGRSDRDRDADGRGVGEAVNPPSPFGRMDRVVGCQRRRIGRLLPLLRRLGEEPRVSLGVVGPIVAAIWRILGRVDDLRARRFGDLVVRVDIVKVDEHPHRRRAGVPWRLQAAIMGALPHHHQLTLKGSLAMHAAARRFVTHLLIEAEGAGKKVERRADVAVEEIGDDLRGSGRDRHDSFLHRSRLVGRTIGAPPVGGLVEMWRPAQSTKPAASGSSWRHSADGELPENS